MRHAIQALPSNANGWQLGFLLPANAQKNLELTGVTRTKPTQLMLEALRKKLGADFKKFDATAVYLLKDIKRGGSLAGLRLSHGSLHAAVLLVSPPKTASEGTLTLLQTAGQEVVGGSTYALRVAKKMKQPHNCVSRLRGDGTTSLC